jgi:4,5-dihydroxyphthalate decarboxylase
MRCGTILKHDGLTQATMIYPKSGPVILKTHLADSPVVAALKAGKVSSPIVRFDFCGPPVAQDGFKRLVQQNEFDAGELAIVTYLQARTYGKPYTGLPAVIVANDQHGSISYIHRGETLHPKDMEGRRAVVRSYSQTGPTWARGVLQHEYGVDLSKVTWVTTDAPISPSTRSRKTSCASTRAKSRSTSG